MYVKTGSAPPVDVVHGLGNLTGGAPWGYRRRGVAGLGRLGALGGGSQEEAAYEAQQHTNSAAATLCFASVQPGAGASETARRNYATFTGCAEERWPDDPLCNGLLEAAASTWRHTDIHRVRAHMQQYGCSPAPDLRVPDAMVKKRRTRGGGAGGGSTMDLARQTLCATPEVRQSGVAMSASACAKNGWRKPSEINGLFEPKDYAKAQVCDTLLSTVSKATGVKKDDLWASMKANGCPAATAPAVVTPETPSFDTGTPTGGGAPPPDNGVVFTGPCPEGFFAQPWGCEPVATQTWDRPEVKMAGVGTAVAVIGLAAAGAWWWKKRRKGGGKGGLSAILP